MYTFEYIIIAVKSGKITRVADYDIFSIINCVSPNIYKIDII